MNLVSLLQAVSRVAPDTVRSVGMPIALHGPPRPPPGFSYSDMLKQLVQFAGYFLAIGAIGFRFGIVRRIRGMSDEARNVLRADNAAILGMLGVLLLLLTLVGGQYFEAVTRKVAFSETLPTNRAPFEFKVAMLVLALVGFAIVRSAPLLGWTLASIAVLFTTLQPLYTGKVASKVNAVHVLAASTWLGTLLVLALVGIRGVMKSSSAGQQRAELVSDLVNSFSPLALGAAAIVAFTGVTTAWLHLKRLSALWTTSYGIALIVKLVFVLIVVVLGAWNWKRVRPSLGVEGTEEVIRRSATMELTFAALVLIATSVLVTLPSPR